MRPLILALACLALPGCAGIFHDGEDTTVFTPFGIVQAGAWDEPAESPAPGE